MSRRWRRQQLACLAAICKYAMISHPVSVRERHQRRQPPEKVEWFKDEGCGSAGMRPGPAQSINDLPVGAPGETFLRERSPQTIAQQPLKGLPIIRLYTLCRVEREPGYGSTERLSLQAILLPSFRLEPRLLSPGTDADRWGARLLSSGTEHAGGGTRLIFTVLARAAWEGWPKSDFLLLSESRSRHLARVLTLVSADSRRPASVRAWSFWASTTHSCRRRSAGGRSWPRRRSATPLQGARVTSRRGYRRAERPLGQLRWRSLGWPQMGEFGWPPGSSALTREFDPQVPDQQSIARAAFSIGSTCSIMLISRAADPASWLGRIRGSNPGGTCWR